MNVSKTNGWSNSLIAALCTVMLLAGSLYSAKASAECWICAGRPGLDQICNKVYGGYLGCVSSNGNCQALGGQCFVTLAKNGGPSSASCAAEDERKKAFDHLVASAPQLNLRAENQQNVASGAFVTSAPTREEMRKLEEMKVEVATDPKMASGADYLRLFKNERRDALWASRVESQLSDQFARMRLAEAGLSRPVVRCASSVCEVSIVQDAVAAQDLTINWQTQALRLMDRKGLLDVADLSVLARSLSDKKIGYVSYFIIDRKQAQ